MSSPYKIPKPNTELRKNVFDLSEKTLFSSSAGLLVPCLARELNPGEKVKISMASLTRTMPLNTAAFVRVRQHYHYFFVPFKQLWSGWDNFINGVDYKTSVLQSHSRDAYKRVPMANIYEMIAKTIKSGEGWKQPPVGFAKLASLKDEFGFPYWAGASRLLDMLGYGISYNAGTSYNKKVSTLWELLDYTQVLDEDSKRNATAIEAYIKRSISNMEESSYSVNILRLLAYQKIYHDFYRREDYEKMNPYAYNIDDFDGSVGINFANYKGPRILELFKLRYRWSPQDYFTGVVPSELYGVDGIVESISSSRFLRDSGVAGVKANPAFLQGLGVEGDISVLDTSGSGISVKSIRAAFAVEKLLRLTRRAGGYDYISQTAAHYGFTPPKGRGDKVQFLGGMSTNIDISEVLSTANSELGDAKSVVGQIYGKGAGTINEGQDIEFTAQEHGVLMCICSAVPDIDYSAEGMNAFNVKTERGDYFQPEFQDLGLQPIFTSEFKNEVEAFGGAGTTQSILGYAPRYAEYKTAYDTLHGEFRNGRSLSAWSGSSSLAVDNSGVVVSSLRVNPKVLDRVTAIEYNGLENTDQFMNAVQFIIKCIRPMSVTGQRL